MAIVLLIGIITVSYTIVIKYVNRNSRIWYITNNLTVNQYILLMVHIILTIDILIVLSY